MADTHPTANMDDIDIGSTWSREPKLPSRFATVLKVKIGFLILTDLMKVFVKFCVIEVFKFWVRS
jgi:hypothetical protein